MFTSIAAAFLIVRTVTVISTQLGTHASGCVFGHSPGFAVIVGSEMTSGLDALPV